MANKRELKKYIRNTCGALAAEILLARAAFPSIERKAVHQIIADIATLQSTSLSRVSVSFDKNEHDFENGSEYRKARYTYFRQAYDKLLDQFDENVGEIVKKMNAALPAEAREAIKEAVAE